VDAVVLRYRGREIGRSEVAFVRELVAAHPQASRRALSAELSRAWGWVQPNGQLRDMLCRSLMLVLARAGHIELPPVRRRPEFSPRANDAGRYPLRVAAFDEAGGVAVRDTLLVIEDTQIEGDANCDGVLDERDMEALIDALFEPAKEERCVAADANDDGRVLASDLSALVMKLAQ
jgi:hypothetical protein